MYETNNNHDNRQNYQLQYNTINNDNSNSFDRQ